MNIGILGTGWIAEKMAITINGINECKLYAVGSRTQETADKFAERFGVAKAYASYEELCSDNEIDLVYIATPHNYHYENMLMALNAGRNVLCEKPFTINAKQAREVIELAREKNLFIAEAIWTRYLPLRDKFKHIHDNSIGTPLSLEANLSYPNENIQRMYDPDLAGGALLDLGVYPINFAIMAFGEDIKEIQSSCDFFETGVDKSNIIKFTYADGKTAVLTSSVAEDGDKNAVITGTNGTLHFKYINNYEWVELHNSSGITRYEKEPQITGYEYQVIACINAIKQGLKETPEMTHNEIIRVMEIMDEIRGQWGLVYPCETNEGGKSL